MAKKGKQKHKHDADSATVTSEPEVEGHASEADHKHDHGHAASLNGRTGPREKMSNKEYEKALKPLQAELVEAANVGQANRLPRHGRL